MCEHHDHGHHHHGETGRTVILNLRVNLILTTLKWIAYAYTGSSSLFGEAAHSTADSLNPIVLMFGHRRAGQPQDAEHPFGHERESFVWSLVAAIMMFVLGACLTAYHGFESLMTGVVPERSSVSLGIMIVALLAEGYTSIHAWRRLRREAKTVSGVAGSTNTVMLAILLENCVDALGVILALTGFGLYWLTGNPLWDVVGSFTIAAIITASSFFLMKRSISLLVGQSADEKTKSIVQLFLLDQPTVSAVTDLRVIFIGTGTWQISAKVQLDRVVFRDGHRVRKGFEANQSSWFLNASIQDLKDLRYEVKKRFPEAKQVFLSPA